MLASNKKRYGVSFFGSLLEYRNVLYTHAYTADWPKAHHEQSVDM